jgi:hypothetical protein
MMLPLLSSLLAFAHAKDCPTQVDRYGDNNKFQNMFCRVMINADHTNDISNRNFTFTDEGMIQVFSNFPGTTNSNSTGARVYYLFPKRVEKGISSYDSSHLSFTHPSGAELNFDKSGRVSSPDLKMTVSKDINSQNKSGVEIQSYSKGIVIDLGYRMGNTPVLNKNASVTITDKNQKKCSMVNSDINKINKDDYEFIYKTNADLYKFLSKKCPGLDLSDLIAPQTEAIRELTKTSSLGAAPAKGLNVKENDSQRAPKQKSDDLGDFIQKIDPTSTKAK